MAVLAALRARAVAFAFSGGRELVAPVSFHLTTGFTGLVGENGAGKTTLLALLAGDLAPTSGTVAREPKDAHVVTCRQSVDAVDASIEVFAWDDANHLDLPSIERLQEALVAYPGALLLVTHDRALAERTTAMTWLVAEGRVHLESR